MRSVGFIYTFATGWFGFYKFVAEDNISRGKINQKPGGAWAAAVDRANWIRQIPKSDPPAEKGARRRGMGSWNLPYRLPP
jgi:hypothetical protein